MSGLGPADMHVKNNLDLTMSDKRKRKIFLSRFHKYRILEARSRPERMKEDFRPSHPSRFTVAKRPLLLKLWRHKNGRIGLLILFFLVVFISLGPSVVSWDPNLPDYSNKLSAPSREHLLGTDAAGRDHLSRLMIGGRQSLGSAVLVMGFVSAIGLIIGLIAGMAGGIWDTLLMRIMDVMMALPPMVMAIAVFGVLGPGFGNMLIAMVFSSWAYYGRLTRSYVLTARFRDDVVCARLSGIRWWKIVLTHIIPGVLTKLIVIVTLNLGFMITWISGLSFLGLGVQPPQAEWGSMLSHSRFYFGFAPWLLLGPVVLIFFSVISFNMIGNALRDILDTKNNG